MEPLRLHDYGASANCYKVRLLLAQLGRPYERVPTDIFAGDTLTDDFGEMNPARTTPVLQIGDATFLQESAAILFYLAEGTPFLPEERFLRAQVVRWLIVEQTDVMPLVGGLRFRLLTGRLEPGDPDAVRRREGGEEVLALLDEHLARHEFLVGDRYSIADVAVYGYTHVAPEAGYDLDARPAVTSWLRRVEARPGFVDDLEPYPENARLGEGRSLYG